MTYSFLRQILRKLPRPRIRMMNPPLNRHFSTRLLSCLTSFLPAGSRGQASRPRSRKGSIKSISDESFVHVEPPTAEEMEQEQAQENTSPEELLRANRELARREALDSLETIVCSEQVKRQLKAIAQWVQICRRHGEDPRRDWYNMVFQGNPGTGMLTGSIWV